MPIAQHRGFPGCIAAMLIIAAALAGCGVQHRIDQTQTVPPQSGVDSSGLPLSQTPGPTPAFQSTPTLFVLGPLVEENLDLRAAPESVPLELQIPALKLIAPVVAVGLNAKNVMDAPKGDIGDPIWHTAFWYRGGGLPGSVGTATIAGHVNDPLGRSEIFANLQDLRPGDEIIIHLKLTTMNIRFSVDEVKNYSLKESSDPHVLERIYGAGPVTGVGPLPAPDGLAHLTLITCAGYIVNGEFDHHTVVYATRIK